MADEAHVDDRSRSEAHHRAISAAFDPAFYMAVYTDLPPDMDPLWHYRMAGWREGRDPAPWFSASAYLATYPDVAQAEVDPFAHFLLTGQHQGRDAQPSRNATTYMRTVDWAPADWGYPAFDAAPGRVSHRPETAAGPETLPLTDEQRAAMAAEFDADYYMAVNPDVAVSGLDAFQHFVVTGWLEGRDPNPRFSVRDYLADNADIAAIGMNPFAHYVIAGRAEGRSPKNQLGFRYDVIARLQSPAERLAAALEAQRAIRPDPPGPLIAALAQVRDLHITFSHDDYVSHAGGVQICVRRESARFAAMGVDHLHLFPAGLVLSVRAEGEPGPLGAMLNGRSLGVHEVAALREALAGVGARKGRRSFAIHSLLGHGADDTADLLAAAGMSEGYFWLHDFASLCSGFHLLRNEVEDCAAPPPDSAACGICIQGPFRARHLDAHRRLFERLALTVVSPSQTTLDFWRARSDLPARGALILPHAKLEPRGPAPKPPAGRPFRVAFLGMPVTLKGWPIFRDLANGLVDDDRYEFLHLGGRPDPSAPAAFHPVVVTNERPRAMQEALEELEVDAALIWPLCRETFSFTAYESAAAGAAVITGPDSGNVAAFARDKARGRVLAGEAALMAAFVSGEILALGRARRKAQLFDLAYSGMTGDLVAEGDAR